MIEKLVAKVFATRNAAHLAHWRTKSYAQHVALGDFYDGLPGKIDTIVEMHQGAFGIIDAISPSMASPSKIIDHIEGEAEWIAANRDDIAGDNAAIGNAVDDLHGLYLTTIYKLKNLS